MRNRACALSEYNKASVLCCAVRVFFFFFKETRAAQQEAATASLPSDYLHSAALRSPAGVAKRLGSVSVLGLHVSWQ